MGVQAELARLGSGSPALAAAAVALSKVLDHPRAQSSKPGAARVMADILDRLRKESVRHPRGGLKLVRAMSKPDPGA